MSSVFYDLPSRNSNYVPPPAWWGNVTSIPLPATDTKSKTEG